MFILRNQINSVGEFMITPVNDKTDVSLKMFTLTEKETINFQEAAKIFAKPQESFQDKLLRTINYLEKMKILISKSQKEEINPSLFKAINQIALIQKLSYLLKK